MQFAAAVGCEGGHHSRLSPSYVDVLLLHARMFWKHVLEGCRFSVQLEQIYPALHKLSKLTRSAQVENHPDAEKLYVERIDIGEAEPRTVPEGTCTPEHVLEGCRFSVHIEHILPFIS
jgi:Putative tRNA binding domain